MSDKEVLLCAAELLEDHFGILVMHSKIHNTYCAVGALLKCSGVSSDELYRAKDSTWNLASHNSSVLTFSQFLHRKYAVDTTSTDYVPVWTIVQFNDGWDDRNLSVAQKKARVIKALKECAAEL